MASTTNVERETQERGLVREWSEAVRPEAPAPATHDAPLMALVTIASGITGSPLVAANQGSNRKLIFAPTSGTVEVAGGNVIAISSLPTWALVVGCWLLDVQPLFTAYPFKVAKNPSGCLGTSSF